MIITSVGSCNCTLSYLCTLLFRGNMASGSPALTLSVPQSGSFFIHSLVACCLGDYKIICTPKRRAPEYNWYEEGSVHIVG